MEPEPIPTETWQVETGGQVYDTNFDEMTSWIDQGALLRIDRVRKGNLRWIEAGKVPQLMEFFNAKDAAEPTKPIVTTTAYKTGDNEGIDRRTNAERRTGPGYRRSTPDRRKSADEDTAAATATVTATDPTPAGQTCSVHPDLDAAYHCETCMNSFCKTCPNSYGGTVRICPFCGAMCKSVAQVAQETLTRNRIQSALGQSFGFGDFGRALAYPFRFKVSLFFGALLFMFFSLGQGAVAFGGIFMLASAIMCFMLANMLTFGILSNTVENFSQGNLDVNFMPSFDDFSLWDDVVHPFFLSIGVYVSSFGPFILVVVVAVFMVMGAAKGEMTGLQSDGARAINPDLPYAANATKQSEKVKELLTNAKTEQAKRVDQLNKGEIAPEEDIKASSKAKAEAEDKYFEDLNKSIQETRKAQLEGAIGKTPETVAKERSALMGKILGYGALFIILGGITLLWGLFYFPAACVVAGYTRSFTATLSPAVGFDTIKRLGSTYALLLLMAFILVVMSIVISGVLEAIFGAFDLPGVGNMPAKALGSIFGFYLSVVFSCLIGFALFKAADRLELPG